MKVFGTLALSVLVAATSAALLAWLSVRPVQPAGLAVASVQAGAAPCTAPPQFTTGFQRDPNGVLPDAEGFAFKGVSWIETRLCQAGRLTLEVQGREAGDEKPRLHVFLNSREIARIDAAVQRQTLELALPEAGLLRLAYLNDYYRSEVRSAVLEEIRLVGAPCTGVKAVQLPPNTGERWAAATVFTSHATLTVQPCSAGQLQFKAVGRSGAGRFPVLTIEQGGRLIKTLHAGAMRQLVRVPVGEQPLSITLTNPYFKELADRNLFIRRWRFQPVATSP